MLDRSRENSKDEHIIIYHHIYRGITFLDCTRLTKILGNGGVPVHQDPVHGIVANHEKWRWALRPFSISGVCDNPVHRVMVNWNHPTPAGWRLEEAWPGMTERRNGFAVFSCSIRIHTLGLWVGTFKYLFIAGQPERWVIDRHKENILIAFFSLSVAL